MFPTTWTNLAAARPGSTVGTGSFTTGASMLGQGKQPGPPVRVVQGVRTVVLAMRVRTVVQAMRIRSRMAS
ncbi:hypothetical protein [Streptomyces sp. NBC_00878]|uniref:hypothetical protein n=1 Tax=Streptomyces sp. NBC_00878 TaxID=2975854 RepID=UPI00224E49C5|nr:hypothetical protein [Streptomyces sp. NBC_00878]MCX4906343.1 hypothetical protein [Streptomyces sp. NBC_00878]